MRAKRGLRDTSNVGGCTKDHVYMNGYFKVQEYLNNGGDWEKLYVGKIGVEHVDLIDEIDGLLKPKYLPDFLNSS